MNRTTAMLLVVVVVSACLVVAVRHENRLEFVRLQNLETEHARLQAEWGRLMLEKATWATGHGFGQDAAKKWGMAAPRPDEIITVELRSTAAVGG